MSPPETARVSDTELRVCRHGGGAATASREHVQAMASELLSRRAQDPLHEAARALADLFDRRILVRGSEKAYSPEYRWATEDYSAMTAAERAYKTAAPAPSAPATAGAGPNQAGVGTAPDDREPIGKAAEQHARSTARAASPAEASVPSPAASPPPAPQVAAEAMYVHALPLKLAPRWDRYGVTALMFGEGERVVGVSLLAHMVEEAEANNDAALDRAEKAEAEVLRLTRERDDARAILKAAEADIVHLRNAAASERAAVAAHEKAWTRLGEGQAAAPPTRGEAVQEGVDRARLATALDDLVSAGGNGASVLHALDCYLLSRRSP